MTQKWNVTDASENMMDLSDRYMWGHVDIFIFNLSPMNDAT